MSSPVRMGETLYGFSKERRGQLLAVSLDDGEILWTAEESADNAALLLDGERLALLTTGGELILGRATPGGWSPGQRHELAESPTWAHPVPLADGLLIKDATTLGCWRASSSNK